MPEGKRISVSFSSDGLQKKVEETAKEIGVPQSKLIEFLVRKGIGPLKKSITESQKPNHSAGTESLMFMHRNAIDKCTIRLAALRYPSVENEDGKIEEIKNGVVSIQNYHDSISFKIKRPYAMFMDIIKKDKDKNLKEMILKELKCVNIPLYFFGHLANSPTPELVMIFLSRADVTFDIEEDAFAFLSKQNAIKMKIDGRTIALTVKISFISIPAYLTRDCTGIQSYLDYGNVSYKTYKNVATEGWDERRYSHLFYIHDVQGTFGGGYFIGMKHHQSIFNTSNAMKKGFFFTGTFQDIDGSIINTYAKFYTSGMKLKINANSLKKLKDNEIERKLEMAALEIADQTQPENVNNESDF